MHEPEAAKQETREVSFADAVGMLGHGTRFVWLGREPIDYITGLLQLEGADAVALDPRRLIEGSRADAEGLDGAILACYHGRTSAVVAKALKQRFGIDTYSLKGGVTAVVGEIF